MSHIAAPSASRRLLTPKNHAMLMIDFQSQMAFATHSMDGITLRNNAALTAAAASGFNLPKTLTTVAEKSFSGSMFAEVTAPFPARRFSTAPR